MLPPVSSATAGRDSGRRCCHAGGTNHERGARTNSGDAGGWAGDRGASRTIIGGPRRSFPVCISRSGSTSAAQPRGDEHTEDFFATLTTEQLVALRDNDVSRAFVEQMRAAGLNGLSVKDLIELHDEGITPHFVLDLREAGLADLTPRPTGRTVLSWGGCGLRARVAGARPRRGDARSAGRDVSTMG